MLSAPRRGYVTGCFKPSTPLANRKEREKERMEREGDRKISWRENGGKSEERKR